jgi:5-methylthioribose kinase
MELLEPHRILRRGLLEGTRYPSFAEALARFLARSLFLTSDIGRPAAEKKAMIAAFAGNTAMCKITEDLIFTEPYFKAPMNRWTSPHLDAAVAALQADVELRIAASRLKLAFLNRAEALAHGDLHTGSVMVTETDTRVIDAEFAVFAPLGFDPGMLVANLLLSAFAQRGHENRAGERNAHVRWILESMQSVYAGFHDQFLRLWETGAGGDAFPTSLFQDDVGRVALASERLRYMNAVWVDALGFAGLEMIRRVVGLSHVIDFEQIADPALRADLERRAMMLARRLVVDPAAFASMDAVADAASDLIGI